METRPWFRHFRMVLFRMSWAGAWALYRRIRTGERQTCARRQPSTDFVTAFHFMLKEFRCPTTPSAEVAAAPGFGRLGRTFTRRQQYRRNPRVECAGCTFH